MPAIQTIIETYIRFADEQALLALRAHRLKLLATISESDPFFKRLRSQCVEEISAIGASYATTVGVAPLVSGPDLQLAFPFVSGLGKHDFLIYEQKRCIFVPI